MRYPHLVLCLVTVVGLTIPAHLSAQDRGFSIHNFKQSIGHNGFLTVESDRSPVERSLQLGSF